MDNRKFQAAASATPPAAEASPSTGYPTDGNPSGGIPATIPGAAWFNQIGEELRNVIVAAGLSPDAAVLTQLLTALRSAGVFQTPSQFDNTTKAATTEFVLANAMRITGMIAITAATTLTAQAHAGKIIQLSGAGGFAVNMYLQGDAPQTQVMFINTSSGDVTIQRQGADQFYPVFQAGVNSFVLKSGDTALLAAGGGLWAILSGTVVLSYAPQFAASLGASGYQKLPSGRIEQHGTFTSSATPGAPVAVTFPIAFPNACRSIEVTPLYGSTSIASGWFDSPATTGFSGRSNVAGFVCHYRAIGD